VALEQELASLRATTVGNPPACSASASCVETSAQLARSLSQREFLQKQLIAQVNASSTVHRAAAAAPNASIVAECNAELAVVIDSQMRLQQLANAGEAAGYVAVRDDALDALLLKHSRNNLIYVTSFKYHTDWLLNWLVKSFH
jgi:hypothetical protein